MGGGEEEEEGRRGGGWRKDVCGEGVLLKVKRFLTINYDIPMDAIHTVPHNPFA